MKNSIRIPTFLLLLNVATLAYAGPIGVTIEAGAENFKWSEYGTRGDRLLEESGSLNRIAARFERPAQQGWLYGGGAQLYFGTVKYDGQTQAGAPAQTNVDYIGFRGEGRGGYLWGSGGHGIGLLGMYGSEFWIRSLRDGQSAGQAVYGYDEFYSMIDIVVGPVYQYRGPTWFTRLHVAAKRPLQVTEDVPDENITLHPKPTTTLYASWENRFKLSPRVSLGAVLFLETLHFNKSDSVSIPFGSAYQPESKRSLMGLHVQVEF